MKFVHENPDEVMTHIPVLNEPLPAGSFKAVFGETVNEFPKLTTPPVTFSMFISLKTDVISLNTLYKKMNSI